MRSQIIVITKLKTYSYIPIQYFVVEQENTYNPQIHSHSPTIHSEELQTHMQLLLTRLSLPLRYFRRNSHILNETAHGGFLSPRTVNVENLSVTSTRKRTIPKFRNQHILRVELNSGKIGTTLTLQIFFKCNSILSTWSCIKERLKSESTSKILSQSKCIIYLKLSAHSRYKKEIPVLQKLVTKSSAILTTYSQR